jgi:RNA-directed DNA polymerase
MLSVHKNCITRFRDKIRKLNKKMRGSDIESSIKLMLPLIRGWVNYFGIAETKDLFKGLDGWIRRKIRAILWRQWKTPRTRFKRLKALDLGEASARRTAYAKCGPWRIARSPGIHKALSNSYIESLGYISMESLVARL